MRRCQERTQKQIRRLYWGLTRTTFETDFLALAFSSSLGLVAGQGVFKHDERTHRLLIYIFCSAVVEKKRRSAVFLWNGCPARFEFRLVIITPSKGTNAEGGYNVTTTYVSSGRRVGWPGMTTYTNTDRLTRLTQRVENRLAHFMGGGGIGRPALFHQRPQRTRLIYFRDANQNFPMAPSGIRANPNWENQIRPRKGCRYRQGDD